MQRNTTILWILSDIQEKNLMSYLSIDGKIAPSRRTIAEGESKGVMGEPAFGNRPKRASLWVFQLRCVPMILCSAVISPHLHLLALGCPLELFFQNYSRGRSPGLCGGVGISAFEA